MRAFHYLLLFVSILLIVSCIDDFDNKNSLKNKNVISFDVSVSSFNTKGYPIETVNDSNFKSIGIFSYESKADFDNKNDTTLFLSNVELNKVNDIWTLDKTYYWPETDYLSFFSYSPYDAEGLEVIDDKNGIPYLRYTVPLDVTKQVDLLVASPVKNLTKEIIDISMSHALSCIGFYANGYGTAIDSICITGISTSGILSLDYNGLSFEWDSLSDISHKYYTSGLIDNAYAGDATENVTVANGYLMMIPQQLTDSAAIVVYFEGEDPDIFYLNSANVDKWEAGNMYLYNLCAGKYFFEIGRRNTTVSYEGGKFEFDITSYYFSQTDTFLNIGWTVEIPDDVDWITGIYDVSDVYGDEISKTLLCAPAKYTATNDLDGGLQQATPYTEADINNLCYVDGSYSTANCYIVNNPGWHKFPCFVMGNGIDKNTEPKINNPNCIPIDSLNNYLDFVETGGKTYEELVKINTDNSKAVLMWQDAPGLISIVELVDESQYIRFYIPPDAIRSGNAVIAICDDNNVVQWSWHIWVTFWKLNDFAVTSTPIFYGHNIGTCMGATYTYESRSADIVFRQNYSNITHTLTLEQNGDVITIGHNSPYYQWGRKDPMLASNGTNGSKECYGDYPFKIEQISSPVTVKTAIENPNVFYCNVDNWNTNAEVNLWSSSKSSSEIYKTIYDPSPIGYRMATYEILDLLNSGEWISKDDYNAYLFDYNDGTVAMYADGMRSGISAEIINDQTKGYYWCNTYYDIDKDTISSGDKNGYWYMEISKDGHSFSNIGTSNAYSVRPVQP